MEERIERSDTGAEPEEATPSRSLVDCKRNVVGFQKNWGANQHTDPGERAGRVGTPAGQMKGEVGRAGGKSGVGVSPGLQVIWKGLLERVALSSRKGLWGLEEARKENDGRLDSTSPTPRPKWGEGQGVEGGSFISAAFTPSLQICILSKSLCLRYANLAAKALHCNEVLGLLLYPENS